MRQRALDRTRDPSSRRPHGQVTHNREEKANPRVRGQTKQLWGWPGRQAAATAVVPSCRYQAGTALACSGHRFRTALLIKAVASVVVGWASERTSRRTTRRKPKPSKPRPSHTTLPSRNSSPSEAPARSLVPKLIALASATKAVDLAGAVDEAVVAASAVLLLCWLQPAPGSVRTPSRATYLASHRTTTRISFRPPLTRSDVKRQPARHRHSDVPPNLTGW
jgi:hypothetical protein